MIKPSIVDIRVMANKAAQKIRSTYIVGQVYDTCRCGNDRVDTIDENALTTVIAEALMEYFGVKR